MPVTQAYCGGSYAAWTAGALFLVHQLCSAPSALKYTQEHAQYTQSVTPSSCGGMFVRAVGVNWYRICKEPMLLLFIIIITDAY